MDVKLLAAVFLASVLTAPYTDHTNASSAMAAATSVQPVRYVVKRFKQTALGCGSDKQEECAWIEVTYPLITSGAPALKSTMNTRVYQATSGFTLDAIAGGPARPRDDAAVARWLARAVASLAQSRQGCRECSSPWFEERQASVDTNLPFTFTISIISAWYAGTAHPYALTSLENYHPVSGRRIRLTNVFKPSAMPEIARIAERLFRRDKGLSPEASLRDAGFFRDTNQFYLSENFALSRSELVLFYNLYEIATYADGATEITIPYRDVRHLLRPESGILPFAR
jgi:hypothetical protein